MKPIILSLLIFLTACQSGSDKSTYVDSSEQVSDTVTTYSGIDSSTEFLDTFSNQIVPWLKQTTGNSASSIGALRYAENWVEDSLIIEKKDISKDFLKSYESMMVYSPSHDRILDLGSYGNMPVTDKRGNKSFSGEPDNEVSVLDLQAKTKRRLLFFGPGTSVDHGYWLNDSTVLVAGQHNESNASVPVIWKIELLRGSNQITRYEYSYR